MGLIHLSPDLFIIRTFLEIMDAASIWLVQKPCYGTVVRYCMVNTIFFRERPAYFSKTCMYSNTLALY